MDSSDYIYKGKAWTLCPTTSGNNSFFHSAFGEKTQEGAEYTDRRAKYRRMRWAGFLTYFENEPMPRPLAAVLTNCLSVNDKYQHASLDDEDTVGRYVTDIMTGEQPVNKEELPILSTLENVKIVVLPNSEQDGAVVVNPNPDILGSYKNVPAKLKEVVLRLHGNTFSRLEPASGDSSPTPVKSKTKRVDSSRYKKGRGNAGSKGVEYQVNLLALVILNALRKSLPQWKLSTENEDAGKFDDVVLEWTEGTVLIQSKHKEDDKKRITLEELTSTNSKHDDFSLPKYFLWFQVVKATFNVKNVIICTNADVHGKALRYLDRHVATSESLLYHQEDECSFHTLKNEILQTLKEKTMLYYHQNFKEKSIEESVITEENLNDFLERLQLYFNYPSIKRLEKIIEDLLTRAKLSQDKISHLEVYCKVMEWFQKKDGLYFTEIDAKAMCAEIRSCKYCLTLEQYKITFQQNAFDPQGPNRVFHVVARRGYLLQMLRIYQTLQANKVRSLYVNPDDGIEACKEVVEAFQLPQYGFLVMLWSKTAEQLHIYDKLRDSLCKHESKRVILVTEDKPVQEIGFEDVVRVDEPVTFLDLSSDSKQRLLEEKNIVYQGDRVSMAELLPHDDGSAIDSETLEKLVRKEDVKVGAPPSNLEEHTSRYYVCRTFNRTVANDQDEKCDIEELQCEKIIGGSPQIEEEISEGNVEMWSQKSKTETIPEDSIFDVNEKLIVIADDAGMGKTTILTKLAVTIKKNHSHFWVLRVTLNDFTRILGESLDKGRYTIDIRELLNSKEESKIINRLEERVFTTDQKVVLMLDGIDEISPDYTDLILDMVKRCQEDPSFSKIFVTTRSHMAADLEAIFKVKPFALQPFTDHNQLHFLTSYWGHNLGLEDHSSIEKCERFAQRLLKKISWTNLDSDRDSNFASIPLHIRMSAEIFQERTTLEESIHWPGCKEYVTGDDAEPSFSQTINVTKLYDMFFKKKWDIFHDKENPERKTWANRALLKQFNECRVHHQSLALEVIGEGDKSHCFPSYQHIDQHIETNLLKIGIVQKCNEKLDFIHRTFADYFLAELLHVELQQNQTAELQVFLLDTILLEPQYTTTRVFLDGFLRKTVDSLPSNTFGKYQHLNQQHCPELYTPRTKLLHVLAQEGCVAILQLILKSLSVEKDIASTSNDTLTVLQQLVRQTGLNVKDENDRTPLHFASRKGLVEMLQFLIEPGPNLEQYKADINMKDKYGFSAMHLAACSDQPEAVIFFKQRDIDIKEPTNFGHTLLHLASAKSNLEMLETVLQLDIDPKVRDKEGYTAVHLATCFGQLNSVKLLVQRGLDVNVTNNHGHTLLHSAGARGHLETLKYLLELGLDSSLVDNFENSLLHQVTITGRLDIIEFLVEKGLDLNVTNNVGRSLLHSASAKGFVEVVKFLLKLGVDPKLKENNGYTALHLAAHFGHVETVKLLVEPGQDINVTTDKGYTLLHSSSVKGHSKTVEYLLQLGMDPLTKTKIGSTALNLAAGLGHVEVMKLLVEFGDLNATDDENRTALHSASANNHPEMVKFLLDLGAESSIRSKNGNTALHLAACFGHLDVVKILVQYGAHINLPGNLDRTPLHLASEKGFLDIVKFLLLQPVDLQIRDNAGFTVLHLACSFGQLDTIKSLVEYGADYSVTNNLSRTLLHSASVKGHLETVKYLLHLGIDPKAKDSEGNTALHVAARFGRLEIVKFFIECGSDTTTTGQHGRTLLHLACESGHLPVVQYLLGAGASYETRDKDGYTILHLSVCFGRLDTVRFLVEYGLDFNVKNNHGRTLLHSASASKCLDTTEFLLELGIDPNVKGKDGNTALHLAARAGQLDIVELLLERGADPNIPGNHDRPLPHFASEGGHLDLIEFFLERGMDCKTIDKDGYTALHIAACFGQLHAIKILAEHGLDYKVTNMNGRTPLHSASANGHLDTVKLLLELGVDHESRDNDGNTAAHLAARGGHLDIVKLFLKSGQVISVTDNQNRTLLHSAAANGHLKLVKCFLDLGVDYKVKGETGNTILHLACGYGHLEVIKLLVQYDLDFNDRGYKERTPLHMASVGGRLDIAKFVLEQGVDTEVKDSEGYTPLHLAATYGQLGSVKLLAESGASFNVTDSSKRTPLHSACAGGHVAITKLLLELGEDPTTKDKEGYTPLHIAANFGRTATVKYLAQYGLYLKVTNSTRRTLMHSASANGHLATVILLYQLGIDAAVRDKDGYTAMHLAAYFGRLKVVQILYQSGSDARVTNRDGHTLLHSSAANGHLETVEFLLRIGLDVGSKNNSGNTALHVAARCGKLETAKLLIERGADVNETGYEGRTALHFASVYGHLDTIKLLVGLGACATIKDEEGYTALHLAASFGCLETVKFFVELGLDFNEPNRYNFTPIRLASSNGYSDTVRFLLRSSVKGKPKYHKDILHYAAGYGEIDILKTIAKCTQNLNDKDSQGRNALHLACSGGNLDIVKFLLELGVESTLRDVEGNTVLHCAASGGKLDIIKFLIEYGLDFKVTNQYGHTLLHTASWNGHSETVQYLLDLGVDVRFRDNYGNTALHLAVRSEDLDTVKFLAKYCQAFGVLEAVLGSSEEAMEFINSGDLTALQSVVENCQSDRRFARDDAVAVDTSRGSGDRSSYRSGCILS